MKKSKTGARLLSVLMTLALLLGLLPTAAFAADDGQELSVAYQPGTYTVTANLVVPGKYNTVLKGIDAYPTNPDNPNGTVDSADANSNGALKNAPTMGKENNAELTVAEDGTMTLSLDMPNPVFTIQQISGCDDAEVLSTSTVTGVYGLKTNRINHAEFKLNYTEVTTWEESLIEGVNESAGTHTAKKVDLTGRIYTFNDCKEHPTLLFMDWTVPLELRVDFSEVPEKSETPDPTPSDAVSLDTDFTGWLTQSVTENGLTVDVYGNPDGTGVFNKETDSYINKPSNMTLHVKEFTREGTDDYAKLYAISLKNTSIPSFPMNWTVWYPSNPAGAGTIKDDSKSAMILTIKAQSSKSEFYLVEDDGTPGTAKKLESEIDGDGTARVLVDPGLYPGNIGNQHCLPQITDAFDSDGVGTANRPAYYVAEKLPDDGSQKFTPGDVTRTAPLDLCVGPDRNNGVCVSERKSIDKLKTEGWKWEQNEDGSGGTLTLKNFYLSATAESIAAANDFNHQLLSLSDNTTIILEGTNIIETSEAHWGNLFGTHCGDAHALNLTIKEGEEGGSLEFRLAEGTELTGLSGYPYILGNSNVKLESGTFKTNLYVGPLTDCKLEVAGGLFEIDVTETAKLLPDITNHGIDACNAEILVSGGTLRIKGGNWADICNTDLGSDFQTPSLTVNGDGNLELSGSAYGAYVQGPIGIDTTGKVSIDNMTDGSWGFVTGGALTFDKAGTYINTATNPMGTVEGGSVTIADADYTAVDEALEKIPADLSIYTDETVQAVNAAKDAVVRDKNVLSQKDVDAMAQAIEDAVAALVKKSADYAAVDAALAKIPEDLSGYTDESVQAVNDAKDAVVRDLTIDHQDEVDAMAKTIEDAVNGLTKKSSGGNGGGTSGGETTKSETVTANLYLPGEYNQVLPGITVYLNNSNNPIQGTGTPTVPKSDNARLVTKADGTMQLTLNITNPVFTLQEIGGCSNATIVSTNTSDKVLYQGSDSGKYSTRISQIVVELNDKSGEYEFKTCTEYPTLLKQEWHFPLILKVQFSGGTDDSLDSKTDVDTSGATGGGSSTSQTTADVTVKVDGDTAAVSKINTSDLTDKRDLSLDVTEGAKDVTGAQLPVSDLKDIVSAKVPNTKLKLSDATVSFDLAALNAAAQAASGKNLELRVLTGSDAAKQMTSAQQTAVNNAKNGMAVSVALTSDSKDVSLTSGKLTVTVPYQWDGKGSVQAWQMDENGKLTSVPVTCKNNVATITLSGPGQLVLTTVDTKNFSDVAADAWYKQAVDWAVANGITSGLTETTFAPNATCTRAQTVTFLWRAAGSPEPTKSENPFSDVSPDAYYYKAVLWAVEQGITAGTSATTFGPDATVSRGQVVTFQYRMAGSVQVEGNNAFTDVADGAYYQDAVAWAAKNGVTAGTSATTFGPDDGCTRGQIVTFLYRQLAK